MSVGIMDENNVHLFTHDYLMNTVVIFSVALTEVFYSIDKVTFKKTEKSVTLQVDKR